MTSPDAASPSSGEKTFFVGGDLPLKIIRSEKRKKTISCTVVADGDGFCIRVLSPQELSEARIRQILCSSAFLQKRLARLLRDAAEKEAANENLFTDGSFLLFLGRRYLLEVSCSEMADRRKKPYAVLEKKDGCFAAAVCLPRPARPGDRCPDGPCPAPPASFSEAPLVRAAFKKYLQEAGGPVFESRAAFFARKYGTALPSSPKSVSAVFYKKKWGCCSADDRIRINFLLMMAPIDIIDYVIVHELCHIRHKNHSAAFWALVAAECPDYRQKRDWLKKNAAQFDI